MKFKLSRIRRVAGYLLALGISWSVWQGLVFAQETLLNAVLEQPGVAGPSPEEQQGASSVVVQNSSPSAQDSQPAAMPAEITADRFEFSQDTNKVYAYGNVIAMRKGTTLKCDKLEYSRDDKKALAEGNVMLISENGTIAGDKMLVDMETMRGELDLAKIYSYPFYGKGRKMAKIGDNQIRMERGYLTTCDHDQPHFRFASKYYDVYPGEKFVARHVRVYVGNVPLLYVPKFTQPLNRKPWITYTPGYNKKWGAFLLTQVRPQLFKNASVVLHLDYREKKEFASGFDINYTLPNYGNGIVRTYYMNESTLNRKHYLTFKAREDRPSDYKKPTYKERFKVEWRHKWKIDDKTNTILQYHKLSDATFLKDYFERQRDRDSSPATYFLFTRNLNRGTFSFRVDDRVNRFESIVERLPELNLDLPNAKIGNSQVYFKSNSTYSNLSKKDAAPTEIRKETQRFDIDNELSRPFKLSIIELRPFVGVRETYYSKTKNSSQYNVIRGLFRTGSDLSTKFFRVFDMEGKYLGMEINKLRHIVTPSVTYRYTHDPTLPSSSLDQFDGIDSLSRGHTVGFSYENKLQTKRQGKTWELMRSTISTNFALKENPGRGGFQDILADIELAPQDWIKFFFDSSFDTQRERIKTANFDLYFNDHSKRWYFDLGKRFNADGDDQITTELGYKINHKWTLTAYNRQDIKHGILKEQNYKLTRDMHEWDMEINFSETRGRGDEILIIFRLKAFPEIGIDAGTGFNRRKRGSTVSEQSF
ncbi:MAG: hypothetical protein A2787_02165 [Omnitrophica WOR_2 bacterium RIFCSPHIGHO2_01_FULL_48_9]|nr:MAG: hypothetical protein A2787_02165 [Omnitrophica WOR_2 bacterium RIFCSPHIGHO2_01_FULL_48_9]